MGHSYSAGLPLIRKYLKEVFPIVDRELAKWSDRCAGFVDKPLADQALASIALKKFHCQGGSAYALFPGADPANTVGFIVALQTISDYLDNLCDRMDVLDEQAFRQLHRSMADAVNPGRPLSDYYRYYPYKHDGGYLESLVKECQSYVSMLPAFDLVREQMEEYIGLYTDLQSLKHLDKNIREERMVHWASRYAPRYPGISCWEFSAATGSTLGVFVLFAAASDPELTAEMVQMLHMAYFPWICGLHILLDYFIDSMEDRQTGDLNFTHYYINLKVCEDRLAFFLKKSLEEAASLPYAGFHITVVKGLLALYLSDPKAAAGLNRLASRNVLRYGGRNAALYHSICRLLRKLEII